MKIVLATNNRHKVEELTHLLAGEGREIRTLAESGFSGEIVEDGATFEENSYIKARTVSERLGCIAVADDSGLEVDCLGGAPACIRHATRANTPPMRKTSISCSTPFVEKPIAAPASFRSSPLFFPTADALPRAANVREKSLTSAAAAAVSGMTPCFITNRWARPSPR